MPTQLCDPKPLHPTLCPAEHRPLAFYQFICPQRPASPQQREQEEQEAARRRFGEGAEPDGGPGEDPQAQAGRGEPQRGRDPRDRKSV